MRVFLSNLGCKLNQAETDAIARGFLARGHRVVGSLEEADLHVVNSCTVTGEAARDSRRAARRGARDGRAVRTVVTGCWATSTAESAVEMPGVDLVVPNGEKHRLVELVEHAFLGSTRDGSGRPSVPVSYVPLALGNARALVKIEDGCDMRCAFCIIPRTRGAQRSRPLREVVDEVRALEAGGHREIVVTGVQISEWRDGGARLSELLDALLAATTASRFRLTSIAPWRLGPALLERLGHPRVCRHLHLSLQSGDDRTLRRMRRPYDGACYAAAVAAARRHIPGIAITTDVIVGFPGETDAEFDSSLAFIEAIGFARLHAFTYSPREGTEAATLADQVPAQRKRERMGRLLEVAARGEAAFRGRHAGSDARVLWEGRRAGRWTGTTDNYLRAFTDSDEDLRGRLTSARLTRVGAHGLDADVTPRR